MWRNSKSRFLEIGDAEAVDIDIEKIIIYNVWGKLHPLGIVNCKNCYVNRNLKLPREAKWELEGQELIREGRCWPGAEYFLLLLKVFTYIHKKLLKFHLVYGIRWVFLKYFKQLLIVDGK